MRKLYNHELNRLTPEEFRASRKIPVAVVLDNVRSMNNIGSVFRTADAFLIEKLYLCGITATPPQNEIHKTALGATETVSWVYEADTLKVLENLKKSGYWLLAIEQAENSIKLGSIAFEPELKIALVFGHEVRGVQQKVIDLCDAVLEVPQFGTKHSINVSVCAGIVLWEISKNYLIQ
ncbi:MAG: RNA methyltransferase [Bacteroidota bacterium]|nr:MAG: RNA methyltransferase [Bacteroidota bacterium]